MGWEAGFFIGAVVLLAAIIYGAVANTRRNRANAPITEQATHELYSDGDAYEKKEGELRAQTRP